MDWKRIRRLPDGQMFREKNVDTDTRMIVLELNELTPSLMQRFMAEGKLPNFSRLYHEAHVYTTTAEEQADRKSVV